MFVALSEDEHALLVTAAQRERLATGAWAAQVLLAVANQAERADYVELREALAAVMHAAGQARRIGVNLNQVVAALHAGDPPTSSSGTPRRRRGQCASSMTWQTS
ncbi:hypothetical protein ACFQY7_17740 [Actinomadura luteofluorescens]|uniref:hypothetical protein n=1 Tax=Actinomadura luteofluorescens TaxID=46163 RepID=UPI00363B7993